MRRCVLTRLFGLLLVLSLCVPALGWSAHGHRTVTRLALDGLSPDMPQWLHDKDVMARLVDQSNEPDRWRGTHRPAIVHEANPEHYIDIEDLDQYGLTLEHLPEYRYEYVKEMVRARVEHPDRMIPIDEAKDRDKTKEWPGFLPWAMAEHFAKLQASFNTLRILEAVNDPERAAQLAQAEENVIYEMGILSHYVGDAAQPLHTTRHHHGWVGPNPEGYTTDNGFHAYIDGRILEIHHLDYDALKARMKFETKLSADPWPDCLAYIRRSYEHVEPLYKLQKDGTLVQDAGKEFISERLCDAGSMLAALYNAAWTASKPSAGEIGSYIKYSETHPKQAAPAPDGVSPKVP
jgi:hypothetical protein